MEHVAYEIMMDYLKLITGFDPLPDYLNPVKISVSKDHHEACLKKAKEGRELDQDGRVLLGLLMLNKSPRISYQQTEPIIFEEGAFNDE